MKRASPRMRDRARALRQTMTEAECRLWSHVRDRGLGGHKVRRQVPIGGYVADFLCEEAALVIEVDGGQHADGADAERDARLKAQGYRVVRYWNDEVLANTEGVLEDLLSKLDERAEPSPQPLSRGERGSPDAPPVPPSPPGRGAGGEGRATETAYDYLRDPAAIYAQSFATVRAETDLARFPASLRPLAERVIHACGMIDAADDLVFSDDAGEAGRAALADGAPILCDCEMVAAGITRARLPADNEVVVTLNDPRTAMLAAKLRTTRSAAATVLWRERLEGSVVAIGNAPTALFHLLERLVHGWPRPALILGFPVGFVGAAESKAALAEAAPVPFVAMRGRRGGSAMASAAVNALAAEPEA